MHDSTDTGISTPNPQIAIAPPAIVSPSKAPSKYKIMQAIFPPFFSLFLVTIDTIPPDNRQTATSSPALPKNSLPSGHLLSKQLGDNSCSASQYALTPFFSICMPLIF